MHIRYARQHYKMNELNPESNPIKSHRLYSIIHKDQHVIRNMHRIQAQTFVHQIRLHQHRPFSIDSDLMMTTIHLAVIRLLVNR